MKWFISVTCLLATFIAVSQSLSIDTRIIGGREAELGQFPYQAALRIKYPERPGYGTCGGTLISAEYTLTAAHCVSMSAEYIGVHLGAHEILNEDEEGRFNVVVTPEGFIVHENYDNVAIANDIALLKFPQKIEFTDRIQPCKLPRRSDADFNFEGKYAISSGWGRYSDAAGSTISPVLKYMVVPVESQKICRHFYGNIEIVQESNICTYTGLGDGVCNGDSGGPLAYVDSTGNMMVIGVTSFVSDIGCVQSGWPSVFVRVTSFLDWIRDNSNIIIQP